MKKTVKDWIIATRPWSFPASAMPVLVTMVWLYAHGEPISWPLGFMALLNIVLVHAAGNVWSDISDYRHHVDTKDSFCVRVLVDNIFTEKELTRLSLSLNAISILMGLTMVYLTGPLLLWIGLAGILFSLTYPILKYRAMGDVVILFCYALLPMTGTSFIVTGQIHYDVLWMSIPVGLITIAILHANNFRDVPTDKRAGIHTLPMLTGSAVGRVMYALEVIVPYVWLVGMAVCRIVTPWILISLLTLPLAVQNARNIYSAEPKRYQTIDEHTAKLQLAFSMLCILGMYISVWM